MRVSRALVRRPPNLPRGRLFLLAILFALGGCGGGGSSDPKTPAAPQNLQATAGDAEVVLQWADVAGVDAYALYHATEGGIQPDNFGVWVSQHNGVMVENVTSPHTVGGLTNGTEYFFVVTATVGGQESGPSKEVSAVPPGFDPADRVELGDIPVEVHRRAAQLLGDMRGTEMAPGWEAARLAEHVRHLYRPDDSRNPAYFEIPVVGETGAAAGYIILAANEDDFPVPHWNFEGEPPSHILERGSASVPFIYYKLDTLSYVAEGRAGELLMNLGDIPPKIEGMRLEWLDADDFDVEYEWIRDEDIVDDRDLGAVSGRLEVTGTEEPPEGFTISEWESWDELKDGYLASYGVFLEGLRRSARDEWEGEQAELEHGIVLTKGQVYTMALLWPEATVILEGPGAEYVTGSPLSQRASQGDAYQITVAARVPLGFTPFTATITYPNNVQESVRFQIVEERLVALSLAVLTDELGLADEHGHVVSPASWSDWTRFWTAGPQRWYEQIPRGVPPNNSRCASGCGATAWAMLFGWADYQACLGNPRWIGRWGIYRQGGGYGADACAPQEMDDGVRNMTWEIRNHIGTFCSLGQGATPPWRMHRAGRYLQDRTAANVRVARSRVCNARSKYRNIARNRIRDRGEPAILGTGFCGHYPLAYGYMFRTRQSCTWGICTTNYQRMFYVNQGWGYGDSDNGWINAESWFAGRIDP